VITRAIVYYDELVAQYQALTNKPGIEEIQHLKVGENLITGESDFRKQFGEPTTMERDLLVLSSAVFAVDVATKRGMNENFSRDIELIIPVVNFHALEHQRIAIERILNFLSHDNWTITLIPHGGVLEAYAKRPPQTGKTLLFSGGLDSFAAAIMLLSEFGAKGVQLVSHISGNTTTIRSQNQLHEYLERHYKGEIDRIVVRAHGKETEEMEFTDERENTQRTRSFLFLTIAALSARRRGMSDIVMIAENGQLAVHLPLSGARLGAFSTHTAHPRFVNEIAQFLTSVLQFEISVQNPFLYDTKGEVVQALATEHPEALSLAVSCWKSSRIGGKHCGACIPCYVRRIALEYHGIKEDVWLRNIFEENVSELPETDEGKRNLNELAMFALDFRTMSSLELSFKHCELRCPDFDQDKVISMYQRFAQEMQQVLVSYPQLQHLL
jgi:7-cyano-7-deazaguanine synthase in queuosine biosynthesis